MTTMSLEIEITELKKENSQLKELVISNALKGLKGDKDDKDDKVAKLVATNSKLMDKIQNLEGKVQKHDEEDEEYNTELASLKEENDQFKTKLQANENSFSRLTSESRQLKAVEPQLRHKMEEERKSLVAMYEKSCTKVNDGGKMAESIAALTETLVAKEAELASMQTIQTELQQQIKELEKQLGQGMPQPPKMGTPQPPKTGMPPQPPKTGTPQPPKTGTPQPPKAWGSCSGAGPSNIKVDADGFQKVEKKSPSGSTKSWVDQVDDMPTSSGHSTPSECGSHSVPSEGGDYDVQDYVDDIMSKNISCKKIPINKLSFGDVQVTSGALSKSTIARLYGSGFALNLFATCKCKFMGKCIHGTQHCKYFHGWENISACLNKIKRELESPDTVFIRPSHYIWTTFQDSRIYFVQNQADFKVLQDKALKLVNQLV